MSKGIMELTEETKQNFTGIGVYAEEWNDGNFTG